MTNLRNITITEENKLELYKKAQELFNGGRPNRLYSPDRAFSVMIANSKGTECLWRKVHYVSFGYNGSQYISHSVIVKPGEEMPEYKMYQIVHYGLSQRAVNNIEPRF
jgi:hypothetical protein